MRTFTCWSNTSREQFNLRFSQSKRFGPAAMEALVRYRWPGNVRELVHVVQQSMVLTDREVIEPEDLPPAITLGGTDDASKAGAELSLRDMQRHYVLSVIERAGGNRAQAARYPPDQRAELVPPVEAVCTAIHAERAPMRAPRPDRDDTRAPLFAAEANDGYSCGTGRLAPTSGRRPACYAGRPRTPAADGAV